MMKKLSLLIGSLLMLGTLVACQHSTPLTVPKQLTFFYGKGCPHCKAAEKFIASSNLKLVQKEVYHNRSNMRLLVFLVRKCDSQVKEIGLPLLWTGNACISGEQSVIKFLKEHKDAQK